MLAAPQKMPKTNGEFENFQQSLRDAPLHFQHFRPNRKFSNVIQNDEFILQDFTPFV